MNKIISYNVNGIRAAIRKGLGNWIDKAKPDILCLQEIKANVEQFDQKLFNDLGYHCFLQPANKPGYSGVAILSKTKPNHIEYGCGISEIDFEGRIIRADYDSYSVMSVYFPSGSNPDRQSFKMDFLELFYNYIMKIKKKFPNIIISGDYNICHTEIDIHNPISNKNSSGFLPEEREWLSKFMQLGFIDSFRHLNKNPHNYTWWSYRANSRKKNLGWRIDYNMISDSLAENLKKVEILSDIIHSDHCPVLVELEK